MAFRKRNVGIARPGAQVNAPSSSPAAPSAISAPVPGIRPSPVDGRPTTSTGTPSFDGILAGHAGLALGSSILIEESGTTDFGSTLLRFYAAEGVVQGHVVHIIGAGPQWGRDLPALVGVAGDGSQDEGSRPEKKERMKIAWRYERLGEFGASVAGSRGAPERPSADSVEDQGETPNRTESAAFCHVFDLTKRLEIPHAASINYIPIATQGLDSSPFSSIIPSIQRKIASGGQNTIHRIVMPTILSPALYPPHATRPDHILQFFHSLRGLLRLYPQQLTALVTLPLELHPRSSGLVRWMELLSDGVLELSPFPHMMDAESALATSGAATAQEEQPQGMLRIHRLPVFHEKGGGGGGLSGLGVDLAFTVSRRKFMIKPFSLPPVEGDTEAQHGHHDKPTGSQTKVDMSF